MVPLLVSLLGLAGAASGARTVKPHILMILADDYGWSDVGYHVNAPGYPSTAAQKKEATTATPYIDSLVKEGVELDQAYVFKYCSPTRCSLQSGRNPIHANVMNIDPTNHNPANPVGGFSALARNLTGIGSVMQRAGYSTAFAGKWDVGMATPDHTPRGRGYDQSLHYFHHTNDYWTYQVGSCPSPQNASNKAAVTDLWEGILGGGEGPAHPRVPGAPLTCPYYQDANRTDCIYEDSVFTNYVLGVISKHAEAAKQAVVEKPLFFCWTPHTVHSPLEVPAAYLSAFDFTGGRAAGGAAWDRQEYMAMVSYMDASINEVTSLLRKIKMWEQTVLVFSADNGGPIYWSGVGGANNYPMKGGKASNWQGGVRVNSFVSGGFLPPAQRGKKLAGLVGIWDWYGTFATLGGVEDWSDKRAAAAGLPPVDSVHGLWDYVSGVRTTSPRTVVHLGSCATSDANSDPFCGKQVKVDVESGEQTGARTTVQGVILDERGGDEDEGSQDGGTAGGLWKVLIGSVWQAGWTGPLFPNNTKGADGKIPDFNDFHFNCSATAAGACLFRLDIDPSEYEDVSGDNPAMVTKLLAELATAQAGVYSVDRGPTDKGACEAAMGKYEGFWGPWLD